MDVLRFLHCSISEKATAQIVIYGRFDKGTDFSNKSQIRKKTSLQFAQLKNAFLTNPAFCDKL